MRSNDHFWLEVIASWGAVTKWDGVRSQAR